MPVRALQWSGAMRIDDLALLSDCRTAALSDRDGTIRWFSPGRFDRASVFGSLLDPDAGHWTIRPRTDAATERAYLDDGPILETTFRTDAGELTLTDALSLRAGVRGHEIDGGDVTHLVRRAECQSGEMELEFDLAARPEYGLTRPHLVEAADGWELIGGPSPTRLITSAELRPDGDRLTGTLRLTAGESASWVLAAGMHDGRSAEAALSDTRKGWRSWAGAHDLLPGPHGQAMRRSAMVLQALTYAPNGVV
ncbi:MAG: trehalase-like domain-containing protein, partial [Candidatus Limnocylindria bacterium]